MTAFIPPRNPSAYPELTVTLHPGDVDLAGVEHCPDCGGVLIHGWAENQLETMIIRHAPTCPQIPKERR